MFVATLGHSRRELVLRARERLHGFGGVPEEVLMDSPRALVNRHPSSRATRLMPRPQAFKRNIAATSSGVFIASPVDRSTTGFQRFAPRSCTFSSATRGGGNSSWRRGGSFPCRVTRIDGMRLPELSSRSQAGARRKQN